LPRLRWPQRWRRRPKYRQPARTLRSKTPLRSSSINLRTRASRRTGGTRGVQSCGAFLHSISLEQRFPVPEALRNAALDMILLAGASASINGWLSDKSDHKLPRFGRFHSAKVVGKQNATQIGLIGGARGLS
jgi:hypothetical protein